MSAWEDKELALWRLVARHYMAEVLQYKGLQPTADRVEYYLNDTYRHFKDVSEGVMGLR